MRCTRDPVADVGRDAGVLSTDTACNMPNMREKRDITRTSPLSGAPITVSDSGTRPATRRARAKNVYLYLEWWQLKKRGKVKKGLHAREFSIERMMVMKNGRLRILGVWEYVESCIAVARCAI
jgi:hypothetical protein